MLSELRDTVPLVMKADGVDPAEATEEEWMAAIDRIREAAESGQIRKFTGNEYTRDLANGDVVAVIGWSGDAIQAAGRQPRHRVRDAGRGLHAVVRRHGDPGRGAQPHRRL